LSSLEDYSTDVVATCTIVHVGYVLSKIDHKT